MFGSILSAVGSIFGGLLGQKSANKQMSAQQQINQQNIQEAQRAQERNIQAASQASATDYERNLAMYGVDAARQDRLRADDLANARAAEQRALDAENTKIQRLVEDAKKAGIHPLAALGSNAASYLGSAVQPSFDAPVQSPRSQTTPGSGSPGQATFSPIANPMGDAVSNALSSIAEAFSNSSAERLNNAQIRNLDAQTAATLAQATSRTLIGRARSAALGGGGGPHTTTGVWTKKLPTASDFSTEYGNIVGDAYGALRMVSDLGAWIGTGARPYLRNLHAVSPPQVIRSPDNMGPPTLKLW